MKKLRTDIENLLTFGFGSKTAIILSVEIVAGIILLLVALLFFADITKDTLFDKEVGLLDTGISTYLYSFRTPLLNQVMIFISLFGADFILVLSTIIAIFLSWRKHKKESILFVIMLLFGFIINVSLKQIFQRPRPTIDPLFTLTSYSFPSGHAMNSFVFYATMTYFTYHFTRNVKKTLIVTCILAILVLLIGFSRVYLGVHYPSDVAAGYAAGALWFLLVLLVERTLTFARLYKKFKSRKK